MADSNPVEDAIPEADQSMVQLIEGLINYLNINRQGDLTILKKIVKLFSKYKYDSDLIKLILNQAESRKIGSITYGKKKYTLNDTDLKFLLSTNLRIHEGGFLPLIPILAGLATAGFGGLAAKRIYDNHKQLNELRSAEKSKNGGFLPFLAIPAIAAILKGIAVAGAAAGGAGAIASAVSNKQKADNEKKFQDAQLEILRKAEGARAQASGSGFTEAGQWIDSTAKNISETAKGLKNKFMTGIVDEFKPKMQNLFKDLKNIFTITPKHDGSGLYFEIRPKAGSGIYLPKAFEGDGLRPELGLHPGDGLFLPKRP